MKIIIVVTTSFLKFGGGMDRVIFNAQSELKMNFEEVTIVTANSFPNVLIGIYKIIKTNPFRYDFIIFNSLGSITNKYNKYWSLFYHVSKILNIKKAIYWHEMPAYYQRFKTNKHTKKEAEQLERKFKNKNSLHLCCSVENSKIAYFFDKNPSIKIINNCILPNKKFHLLYDKFTVCSVGSIQKRKGTDFWTAVAIKTCLINPNIQFIWCGSEFEKELSINCNDKVKEYNLTNQIMFLGHVEEAKMTINSSHLFFLSSREDTFALSVLEAMSYSKNIIHYNSGGVLEQVGEMGILIENFNIEATVNAILQQYNSYVEDPKSIYNLKMYDRFIENYTPKIFTEKFKNALS